MATIGFMNPSTHRMVIFVHLHRPGFIYEFRYGKSKSRMAMRSTEHREFEIRIIILFLLLR